MKQHRGIFSRPDLSDFLAEEPPLAVDQLSGRLWTVTDGRIRTLFFDAKDSVVAFDTFGTPGCARAYRKAIESVLPGKSIGTVVYTHDHLDHAGFAANLAPGAEVIADELCAEVIRLRGADGQLEPTRVLSGPEHAMAIGGVEFMLLNPGPTHGSGNLSAWFPAEKLLFSSDTILTNARYGLLPDYHLANFTRHMRGFLDLEFDRFVPGRYDLGDRSDFERGCDYLEAIQVAAQQAFIQMVPIWMLDAMQGFVGEQLRTGFGDLDGFDQHVGLTSLRVVHHYLMGGWGIEDTPAPRREDVVTNGID